MDRNPALSPLDQEPAAALRPRRTPRHPIEGRTHLRPQSWYNIEVRVRDVSTCGFMAECDERVQIGSYVSLDVPGVGPVHAQVRWQVGTQMGGMFLDPISLGRCEWLAVKAEPPASAA
jgi:hypothetical protein